MASTELGTRLTEAHRLAAAELRSRTVTDFATLYRILDPANVEGTFPGYAEAVRLLIRQRRATAENLAAAYLRAFREAEGITAPLETVALAGDAPEAQVRTVLHVTGPAAIKRATRKGLSLERAATTAFTLSAGAVSRLVLDANRATVVETARRDPFALGWARVTDGDPCFFCAMLASRGPVYFSEATAGFEPHGKCACVPETVYRRDTQWPGRARELRALYDDATAGKSGPDAVNAFRRAYDAQRKAPASPSTAASAAA